MQASFTFERRGNGGNRMLKKIIVGTSLLAGCIIGAQQHTDKTVEKERWVTVIIHGTSRPYLSVKDFFKVANNTVENSLYETTTANIRNNPFFYQAQPMQDMGLQRVSLKNIESGNGAQIFASIFDRLLKTYNPNHTRNAYYTFGWSGLLSLAARRKAAEELFHALNRRFAMWHKIGIKPKLRIIAYSHGGNIALYLSEVSHRTGHKPLFNVDELVLVGMPIHTDTDYMTNDKLFKSIINIYSTGDLVQPFDFLSTSFHTLGYHTFEDRKDFKVPDKITQLRIRIKRKFLELNLGNGKKRQINRNDHVNPGHTELWYFGWAAEWYRREFPLFPFSIAVLTPYFSHLVHKHGLKNKFEIILAPETGLSFIKKERKIVAQDNFIDASTYSELKQFALSQKASSYKLDYHKVVHTARKDAKRYHRRTKKSRLNGKQCDLLTSNQLMPQCQKVDN